MRIVIIALVALLLLGGGGAGAYFYFYQPAEASAGEEVAKAEGHAKKEKAHEPSAFVEMDPLILPIVDGTGVTQTVSLVIALQVADEKAVAEVEHMSPKLKDAYIQDMYGVLNQHAAMKDGVIQVSAIKKRLNEISDEVMGDDTIQDVLLQVVQQRPI
jgi:flagellar protein FliL